MLSGDDISLRDRGATALAVDPDGRALVIGTFSGTLAFGGESLTSAGDLDVFVARR